MSSGNDHCPCGNEDSCTYANEDNSTELHFATDGRVYLFGASAIVLDAILASGIEDEALRRRMTVVRQHDTTNGVADVGFNCQSKQEPCCGTNVIDTRHDTSCLEAVLETRHGSTR